MPKRIQKVVVGVAALAALALGGSVIAQAGTPPAKAPVQSSAPTTEDTTGPDTDNVQSGDQTTPDSKSESKSAAEPAESAGSESESAPDSDGPGGHADEAGGGNASANHEAEGAE
jgi:hypothetical protein